jgi:hypothetical protein
MYRRYRKDEGRWPEGVTLARAFIAGPLYQHVSTWTRYGQLGVQEYLDCNELCTRLPRLLEHRGDFLLVFAAAHTPAQLLVFEVGHGPSSIALCYGPWPGNAAWETQVQPALSPEMSLARTSWNRMPRLEDFGAAARDQPEATVVERRRAWLDEDAGVRIGFGLRRRTFEATAP